MFSTVSNNEQMITTKGVSSMAKKKTMTIQKRVETALLNGEALTSNSIKSRFGAGNPGAVIQALRFKGLPVFLNTNKRTGVKVYIVLHTSRLFIKICFQRYVTMHII